jgi:hypothetical protein
MRVCVIYKDSNKEEINTQVCVIYKDSNKED